MAVFLLKALEGSDYLPPACTVATFTDVPCSNPFSSWIYELAQRQITGGCGGNIVLSDDRRQPPADGGVSGQDVLAALLIARGVGLSSSPAPRLPSRRP